MPDPLPRIYPITDREISGLSHLEQVRLLANGGATLIQLRDKTASSKEFYEAAARVVTFGYDVRIKIVINDRVDIAIAVGADGVHLGQDDLPPEEARKLLGKDAIIGFSTHSLGQARDAVTKPINYIGVGPIFSTSTKADHYPVIGLEGLRSIRNLVGVFPVVAIGGIDRRNAPAVIEAGADSVALISDLLSKPDEIVDRMRQLAQL